MDFSSLSGERVLEERVRLGLSQAAAGESCGVSREMWGRYERGKASMGIEVLSKFALIGADTQYILTGERRATAPQLAPDEEALLKHYRQLDPGAKQILLSTCNLFAGQSAAPSSGISVSGTGNRVAGRDYNEG